MANGELDLSSGVPLYRQIKDILRTEIAGEVPADTAPTVLAGDPRQRSTLLQWHHRDRPVAAVSVNHRMPIVKLKKLGARASATT